jgi:3-deoxy-D-manno-octulosonic-acid transferase
MSGVLMALYNALLLPLLAAAAAPVLLTGKWREGLGERLGTCPVPAPSTGKERIWIHGASVGEVLAADGLVRGLLERHPEAQVVFSTFTAAGKRTAQKKYAHFRERVTFTLAPLDWDGLPARAIRRFDPALFIILETELWPNLLSALSACGCPLVLVNGRLSEGSFPRYLMMRRFFRPLLGAFSLICARTATDAERFRRLGAEKGRVRITGNMKYDGSAPADLPPRVVSWRSAGEGSDGRIVAGSLRGGETEVVLEAFVELRRRFGGLQIVLAPRYPDRFDTSVIDRFGLAWVRWSETPAPDGKVPVVLVDTLGELASLYAVGSLAFVGGTMDGTEGQNLLEPAMHSVPVLFGPGYRNFEEEGRSLIESGGGFMTVDGPALVSTAARLLGGAEERIAAGARARCVAERFGGAVERTLDAIDEIRGKEAQ